MKDFLKHYGLWILFVTALAAVGLALLSVFSTTSSPLVNLAGMVTGPFRAAYTAVSDWVADKQNYYQDTTALLAENEALKNQIAEMEAQIRQARADSEENQRLRTLLNLRQQRSDMEFEAASVTEHSTSNWTRYLTMDRGSDHGVAQKDCVITEAGYLVGVVDQVGTNWCTVLTIVDTDTSLGARVFRTNEIGVAEGDFSLMTEGRLRLDFLPAESQLLNGDLVVTSGLGGYYPAGLVIGTVEAVQADDAGATAYAVLRPSAELDTLSDAYIIKSFDIVD